MQGTSPIVRRGAIAYLGAMKSIALPVPAAAFVSAGGRDVDTAKLALEAAAGDHLGRAGASDASPPPPPQHIHYRSSTRRTGTDDRSRLIASARRRRLVVLDPGTPATGLAP